MPRQDSLPNFGFSTGEAINAQVTTLKTMPLLRTAIYPPQDPNVHTEQLTTLRIKFLLAILPAISDTITVIVTLPDVSGAVQVTREPSPESTPPVYDHS